MTIYGYIPEQHWMYEPKWVNCETIDRDSAEIVNIADLIYAAIEGVSDKHIGVDFDWELVIDGSVAKYAKFKKQIEDIAGESAAEYVDFFFEERSAAPLRCSEIQKLAEAVLDAYIAECSD